MNRNGRIRRGVGGRQIPFRRRLCEFQPRGNGQDDIAAEGRRKEEPLVTVRIKCQERGQKNLRFPIDSGLYDCYNTLKLYELNNTVSCHDKVVAT